MNPTPSTVHSASPLVEAAGIAGLGIPPSSGAGQAPLNPSGSLSSDLLFETMAPQSSAADLTVSQQGAYLVGLLLRGGATPGWLQVLLSDNVFSAILPAPASGLDVTGAKGPAQYAFYPMSVGPLSGTTAIPSGAQTYGGGLVDVQPFFSSKPNPHAKVLVGPSAAAALAPLRAVAVTGNESATTGTAKTYTVPGGNTVSPRGFLGMFSAQAGSLTGVGEAEFLFPAQPPFTGNQRIPAEFSLNGRMPRLWPVGKIGPASSFSVTHKAISLGGATALALAGVLFI